VGSGNLFEIIICKSQPQPELWFQGCSFSSVIIVIEQGYAIMRQISPMTRVPIEVLLRAIPLQMQT